MGVEMLLTRVGALALINTHLVVFSFVLCFWLAGMGLGGPLGGLLLRWIPARRLYALLQLTAALLILGVPWLRRWMWSTLAPTGPKAVLQLGNLTLFSEDALWLGTASLGCGLVFGSVFLPANRLFLGRMRLLGSSVGGVMSVLTLGGIAGSLVTGFLVMPAISAVKALLVCGAICLVVGVVLLATEQGRSLPWRASMAAAGILGLGLIGVEGYVLPDHEFLARYNPFGEVLFYRDGRSTTDAVVLDVRSGEPLLIPNGEPPGRGMDVGTFIPGLLHPRPARSALLAFAAGKNVLVMLRDPAIETLYCAELSDNQLEATRYLYGPEALEGFADPRFEFVSNDARNFLLTSSEPFDYIFNDTAAYSAYLHLASRDFLEVVRGALAPDGIYATKLHPSLLDREEQSLLIRTFLEVFPMASLWVRESHRGPEPPPFLLLVGYAGDTPPSFAQIQQAAQERSSTENWGTAPCEMMDLFLAGPTGLRWLAGEGPTLDDMHPIATPEIAWRHIKGFMGYTDVGSAVTPDDWRQLSELEDPSEWFHDLADGSPCEAPGEARRR
jgi:spermidine synthase